MVSGCCGAFWRLDTGSRRPALTGSFLLLSRLSQVLLTVPGTALPLQTDLMLQYLRLMQSTALGKKSICKSPRWCWIPSSEDCGGSGRVSEPADGTALRQTGRQQLCGVCSLCVPWGSDTATCMCSATTCSGTSKRYLFQRRWSNARVLGSVVRMAGN